MITLIDVDNYPETAALLAAVKAKFAEGAGSVWLKQDDKVIGILLEPNAVAKVAAVLTASESGK